METVQSYHVSIQCSYIKVTIAIKTYVVGTRKNMQR